MQSSELSAPLLLACADVMMSIRRPKLFKNQRDVRQRIGRCTLCRRALATSFAKASGRSQAVVRSSSSEARYRDRTQGGSAFQRAESGGGNNLAAGE